MYFLRTEYLHTFSLFLKEIRSFFNNLNYIEIESPLLQKSQSVEAYLDSMQVERTKLKKNQIKNNYFNKKDFAYLITSPEYTLKAILAELKTSLFQIAHVFRSGDYGPIHLEEFLLLEWYSVNLNEFELMDLCEKFFIKISNLEFSKNKISNNYKFKRSSVKSLFEKYANCLLDRISLEEKAISLNLTKPKLVKNWAYTDLFFSVFLNFIEPHLGKDGPEFVYHYPKELRAFSKIENDYCKRFEIYWNEIELANAYNEIQSFEEYKQRFKEENLERKKLKKSIVNEHKFFFKKLELFKTLPLSSGIALGLDRLFMLLMKEKNFKELYEIYND